MLEVLNKNISLLKILFWVLALILILIFWPQETKTPSGDDSVAPVELVLVIDSPNVPKPVFEPQYGFNEDEIYLLTVLLCGSEHIDGDGEYDIDFGLQDNYHQIYLPLNVVMNRVRSEGFPDTVEEVIWQPRQFISELRNRNDLPVVSDGSYQIVKVWCERYDKYDDSVQVIPEDHYFYNGNGYVNKSRKEW